jgi:hypothetical protein
MHWVAFGATSVGKGDVGLERVLRDLRREPGRDRGAAVNSSPIRRLEAHVLPIATSGKVESAFQPALRVGCRRSLSVSPAPIPLGQALRRPRRSRSPSRG